MATHYRAILPVGHGAFSVEHIGNFTVVLDCGSASNPQCVSYFISQLVRLKITTIDCLFISHFDNDHVNGINELINNNIQIRQFVAPYIPQNFVKVYNSFVNGAYSIIMHLLVNIANARPLLDNYIRLNHDLWEWRSVSMITANDWTNLSAELTKRKLNMVKLMNDIDYVNRKRRRINAAFKAAFNVSGPNDKGLLVLSQRVATATCTRVEHNHVAYPHTRTSCLYAGDANLKKWQNISLVQNWLNNVLVDDHLFLIQIPHHGSKDNIRTHFDSQFVSELYYVSDSNNVRISQQKHLYNRFIVAQNLIITGVCYHNNLHIFKSIV